jgi:hypothetical protein
LEVAELLHLALEDRAGQVAVVMVQAVQELRAKEMQEFQMALHLMVLALAAALGLPQ